MNVKIILAAAAMIALAGCAGNGLSGAEKASPQGSEFQNALSGGYLRLARAEQAEYDYADADYFAARAIASAQGTTVALPEANARNIPQADQLYVLAAREELNEILEAGARDKVPQLAATAQIAYECWVQELEENTQEEHIAACRDQLDGLIPALRNAITEQAAAPAPAPQKKKLPRGKTYKVYYPTGGINLDAKAREVVAQAAAHAAQYPNPRIVVSGYTDTQGGAAANEALSLKRARKVAVSMVLKGVPENGVSINGYGEEFPDVRTADGVAEPKNRRVELQVGGN